MSDVANLKNYVDDLGTMTGANLDCELWKRKYHEITLIIVNRTLSLRREIAHERVRISRGVITSTFLDAERPH